jgi:hypothetical protein
MTSVDTALGKSPFGRSSSSRAACAVTLTLVFLCGAVAGALAMNFGIHKGLHRDAFWTQKGKIEYLDRVKKDLSLTPAQTEQMESILDDFSSYYRTVLADGKSRILQILNDDQRKKFEQILQERQRP